MYTWNLVQDVRMIPKKWSIMDENQMHTLKPYCFSLYKTKEPRNYSEAAHYAEARIKQLNQ